MMRIRVLTHHGRPASQAIEANFGESGGSIGRADTNQLILPDPERHISRVQARIVFRDGGYFIADQGANPVLLNGSPVGNGNQAALADGDELRIGEYVLHVSKVPQSSAAGLDLGSFGAAPAQAAAGGAPVDDPLALFGGGTKPSAVPFTDRGAAPPAAPQAVSPREAAPERSPFDDLFAQQPATPREPAPPAAAQAGVIPEDFDPFADQYAAKPLSAEPAAPAKLPDDFDLGLGPQPAGAESIDALFGLTPGSTSSSEPFAQGGPLGEQASQPNTASAADPFAALGLPQQAAPAPVSDHVPELHGSFSPPAAKPDVALRGAAAAPGGTPQKPADAGMVLSWEREAAPSSAPSARTPVPARPGPEPPAAGAPPQDPLLALFGGEPATASGAADALGLGAEPSARKAAPAAAAEAQRPQPSRSRDQAAATPPGAARPAAASAPARSAAPGSQDELLAAFLRGLGTPNLQLQGISAETMELIGLLLREAVQGTLDLLLARAMTKREIRADVTMIVGRDNNPLKFSPDVAVALVHLLTPQGRGFMPPLAAMQDAYDDLRSHTFGFMAGMRAALAGVLARFDPANLETRLTQKTMLDSLLPMNRRAKLWDLFTERYHEISQEAEEDFHTLFGREFLRAYEEQVARLRDDESSK